MSGALSIRKMAENEVVFRKHNERVQRGLENLKKMAAEDGQQDLIAEDNMPLRFYCECADENCRDRITIRPSEYAKIHSDRSKFIIICGHEVAGLEKVVNKKAGYCVAQKYIEPSETATHLNVTGVDNS